MFTSMYFLDFFNNWMIIVNKFIKNYVYQIYYTYVHTSYTAWWRYCLWWHSCVCLSDIRMCCIWNYDLCLYLAEWAVDGSRLSHCVWNLIQDVNGLTGEGGRMVQCLNWYQIRRQWGSKVSAEWGLRGHLSIASQAIQMPHALQKACWPRVNQAMLSGDWLTYVLNSIRFFQPQRRGRLICTSLYVREYTVNLLNCTVTKHWQIPALTV